MKSHMKSWEFVVCILALSTWLGACDDSAGSKDAGPDSVSDVADDGLALGDADLIEDGGLIARCGPKGECGEDELCVFPQCNLCLDGRPGSRLSCPAPYCLSVKEANCRTCDSCFEDDPCRSRGECQKIIDKQVICGCPRDTDR